MTHVLAFCRPIRAAAAALLAVAVLWAPRLAQACAACSTGRDDANRAAFIGTTVFLSVLPLLLVGGLAWWLRRRVRALEQARQGEPESERDAEPVRPLAGRQLPLES